MQRCLLLQHVGARCTAGSEAKSRDIELSLLRARNIIRRSDLRAQRGLVDGGRDDIRGEREVACFQCKLLVLGLRLQRLYLAPCTAERIERVRHIHRGGLQIVVIGARESRNTESSAGPLLALAFDGARYARIIAPALRGDGLIRLPQGCLRGLQRRAVGERAFDERIELCGLKQSPPLTGNVHAVDKALRLATQRRCRRGLGGHLTGGREARVARRFRGLEIRSDRTG